MKQSTQKSLAEQQTFTSSLGRLDSQSHLSYSIAELAQELMAQNETARNALNSYK